MPDEDREHVVEVAGDGDKPVEVVVTVKGVRVRVVVTLAKRDAKEKETKEDHT